MRRWSVILGLLVGYAWYYVCRQSLIYVGPALAQQQGLDMREIGFLVSLGQISIGVSKMGGSVLTADWSPSFVFSLGLALTGLCNIAAAAATHASPEKVHLLAVLGTIWAINGIWQGFGSPACARMIDSWCKAEERGTFWAIWNTSNNVGGAIAPVITGIGVAYGGWRGGLLVSGLSALFVAAAVLLVLADKPRRELLSAAPTKNAKSSPRVAEQNSQGDAAAKDDPAVDGLTGWSLLWQGCLRQEGLVQLTLANFTIYGMRSAIISWLAFYILSSGSHGIAATATLLSSFELGGLLGSLAGGVVSDWRMRRTAAGPVVGIRVQTSLLGVLCFFAPAVMALWLIPISAGIGVYLPILFAAGFGLYVSQALTALCGLELVPRRAVGTSQGLLGLAAYLGAASAGLPLGWLIQGPLGWRAWHGVLLLGTVGVLAALLPLRRTLSYRQRRRAAAM